MMETRLTSLLKNPLESSIDDFSMLKKSIEKYPYFYQIRAIQLYALKKENHPSYEDFLHLTSLYSHNRAELYHYLHTQKKEEKPNIPTVVKPILVTKAIASEPVDLVEEIEEEEEIIEPISTENFVESVVHPTEKQEDGKELAELQPEEIISIEEEIALEKQEDTQHNESVETEYESKEDIPSELIEHTVSEQILNHPTEKNEKEKQVAEKISEPLITEKHTFSDWLKMGSTKIEEKEEEKATTAQEEKLKIIDTFLQNAPRITPLDKDFSTNTPKKQHEEPQEFSELMTETLAQIYTDQHKYDKAIRAYKILCLKYPKKNAYFADRIQEIENLKNKK